MYPDTVDPIESFINSLITSERPVPDPNEDILKCLYLDSFNPELEKAGRVADFLELGELFAKDALTRNESCGGHFREEHQTEEGEALRDDENYSHVSAWEYKGESQVPELHKEELEFESVQPSVRSYK